MYILQEQGGAAHTGTSRSLFMVVPAGACYNPCPHPMTCSSPPISHHNPHRSIFSHPHLLPTPQAVHTALTEPHLWLEGLRGQVGVDASSEDACLAYSLFDQVGGWVWCVQQQQPQQQQRSRRFTELLLVASRMRTLLSICQLCGCLLCSHPKRSVLVAIAPSFHHPVAPPSTPDLPPHPPPRCRTPTVPTWPTGSRPFATCTLRRSASSRRRCPARPRARRRPPRRSAAQRSRRVLAGRGG